MYGRLPANFRHPPTGGIPEKESLSIFHKLVTAVTFLHERDIAHRNLTCETVLYNRKSKELKECSKLYPENYLHSGNSKYGSLKITIVAIFSKIMGCLTKFVE